ncbi:MAG: S8 family serine peptidase [candidate division Zixibacteria bacterium]|nr:S8 family serine peptidase [candidate division Zixibacteria bacterium]
MKTTLFILTSALLLLLAPLVTAGNLSPELSSEISNMAKDSLVAVWIQLPKVKTLPANNSKSAAPATRAKRYSQKYNSLKSAHQASQQQLLGSLKRLRASGKSAGIKPSWLANVVEAKIAAGELEKLSKRNDIKTIYLLPELTSIQPDNTQAQQSPSLSAGTQSNLIYINADQAWLAGFTGAGRVICSFDTGVDGDHPALYNSWKGHDGDSAAAWFDPRDGQPFPHNTRGDIHGTHIMGIMVGHDGSDTVGVALDAKWISAAIVDITGASYIDAFEWAANPDGDPNSMADVPDVINHSWGLRDIGCQEVFYELIENLEALGIVNIFAAGNDGQFGSSTIRNPANRALDSIDCFAVGAVQLTTPTTIWSGSSRGPSDCNGAIKPNVTAPGQGVRSTTPNGFYGSLSGTSIAAPHVSGLVALMRQKNPNATVAEIKTAILTSTQQFGLALPDNTFGWGVIDCMAALNKISAANPDPNIRVYDFDHEAVSAGGTFRGRLILQNLGADVSLVSVSIIGSDVNLAVTSGSAFFGFIGNNDTVSSNDSIIVNVSSAVEDGAVLSLDLEITNGSSYTDTTKIYFSVGEPTERSLVSHNVGNIEFGVSNFGTYGLGPPGFGSFFPIGGPGFTYNGGFNDLFEGGLLIATDAQHVSDGIRNSIGEPDGDFRVLPGGNIQIDLLGSETAQKTKAIFDDSRAENPIGISVKQLTYTFPETENDDFVILRYILTNDNPFSLTGVYVGLYFDWDIKSFAFNAGGYENSTGISWIAYNGLSGLEDFRATVVLDGLQAGTLTDLGSAVYYPEGYTESEKFLALTAGFGSATTYATAKFDLFQVISVGPISLTAGQSRTVSFAIIAGNSMTEVENSAGSALAVYDSLINGCCSELSGDVNNDSSPIPNVLDLTYLVDFIFRGGPAAVCPQEANLDGSLLPGPTILDLTYIIDVIFRGGPDPIACPGY